LAEALTEADDCNVTEGYEFIWAVFGETPLRGARFHRLSFPQRRVGWNMLE